MKRALGCLVPLAIVLAGGLLAAVLVLTGRKAERQPPPPPVARVEVAEAAPAGEVTHVVATGTVEPVDEVVVTPELSGRIAWVSPRFVPGGRFAKGEVMLRLDDRDQRLAVRQEEGRVAQAELELRLEEGRGELAAAEWEMLADDAPETPGPAGAADGSPPDLALRRPHLEAARLNLEAARSALERARLNLDRTRLRAPFDATVVEEAADLGQAVSPQSQLGRLVGTAAVRVRASVPAAALPLVEADPDGGSPATITWRLDDGTAVRREGRVTRVVEELDPTTRRATVLVRVDHPLDGEGVPLLPGAFVEVDIAGRPLAGAVSVPEGALREGAVVWVYEAEGDAGVLRRRPVAVAWREPGRVLLREGVAAGERVVVSPLALPVEGMAARLAEAADAATDGEDAGGAAASAEGER